jgi:hypothetical protein
MFLLALIVGSTIVGAPGCASNAVPEKAARFTKPAFKGVELYSWQDKEGAFRYALHWGTNRAKEEREIKFPSCVLESASAVKRALNRLAPGEWVFWYAGSQEKMNLAYPSPAVMDDLVKHSKSLGLNLSTAGDAGSLK